MFDLPPSIPVISACADALHAGWQEAEKCLFENNFTFAEHNQNLEQIELDYWTTLNLLDGQSLEEAVPKGDTTKILESGTELTNLDSAFLLVDFDNQRDARGEIHRVYEGPDGAVVLLDDHASSSLTIFSSYHWNGFESAFPELDENGGETAQLPIAKLASAPFAVPDHSWMKEIYYRIIPSAYPDESVWTIMAVNPEEFRRVTGKEPSVIFYADLTITRKY